MKVNDGPGGAVQTDPDIATGKAGELAIVWTDDRNGTEDIYLSVSKDAGAGFSLAARVDDSTNDTNTQNDNSHQNSPKVAMSRPGKIFAAWTDARRGNRDIWATVTGGANPFENAAPELSQPGASPDVGSTATLFAFTINYTDREGNPPAPGFPRVRIYHDHAMTAELEDSPFTMEPSDVVDENYVNGRDYQRAVTIGTGGSNYTYVFEVRANGGNVTMVKTKPFYGPVVDDEEVTFADPSPLSSSWQLNQYAVMCNITVSDTGGAGVDLTSNAIQYRHRAHHELYFSEWETFWYNSTISSIENLDGSYRLMTMVNFPGGEGTDR